MRFAIRDDDVNFFTRPEELESCYGEIWDRIPPTFSVISHVKGDWTYWAKQLSQYKQNIDWNAWRNDNKVYPLFENIGLLNFLKEKLTDGKLDISLHAVHHRNEDPILPPIRTNNYVQGAEFFTTCDKSEMVKDALSYLQRHLNKEISVFTPPQNLLSFKAYRSIIGLKLSIIGPGIPFWKKELSADGIVNMQKVLLFKLLHSGKDYPHTLYFKNHAEIIHHYPLHPTTLLDDLVKKFNYVYRRNGDFVLSTHYHEFNAPLVYDSALTMKNIFNSFMNHVLKQNDITFCTLSELCSINTVKK